METTDPWMLAVLNAPTMWWWSWRRAVHGKDEALRFIREFIVTFPIPAVADNVEQSATLTSRLASERKGRFAATTSILDWLQHEFGLEKSGNVLGKPQDLDADAFAAAVRKALPRSRKLSAADIQRLKEEHRQTVEPARIAAAEAQALERRLSDLVNTAYGLTPEEVLLMWATAPPRMPFTP